MGYSPGLHLAGDRYHHVQLLIECKVVKPVRRGIRKPDFSAMNKQVVEFDFQQSTGENRVTTARLILECSKRLA
jgi:hypothetical protein